MEFSYCPESLTSNRMISFEELIQGQEFAEKLCLPENKVDLASTDLVAIQASHVFSDTFSVMSNYNVNHVPQIAMYSPNSSNGSRSKDVDKMEKTVKPVKDKRGYYNRKNSWTSTKVTASTEDGHKWRKYGQKEILNAKHKRNYYRCIYKFDQGCQATKQVQKIEDEPMNYKITYHQYHTCKNFLRCPEISIDSPDPKDTSILLSFESNGPIEKKQIDPHFRSIKHEEQREVLPSPGVTHNQSLPFDCDQFGLVSMMSPGLEHDPDLHKGIFPSFCD